MNLENIKGQVCQIALSVGGFLKKEQAKLRKSEIEMKGTRNYVTHIDKEAEEMTVEMLGRIIPGASFLTEEGTVDYTEGAYTWIIDPLDGTTNYVHGDALYSVSIALMREKEVVVGVVYDPMADELFAAAENGEATLNGKPLKVSAHNTLTNGYIGFGIPYTLNAKGERILRNAFALFRQCSFRIKGSAALEICYVAAGRSDAYFHSGLSPWDVAAGVFILERAGGTCSDFSGGRGYLFNQELVATNAIIHPELMEKIILA